MATIQPGMYTVGEIFSIAGFDLAEKAAADHSPDGVDRRRVRISGLPFDDVDKVIEVNEGDAPGAEIEITVDGKVDTVLTVGNG